MTQEEFNAAITAGDVAHEAQASSADTSHPAAEASSPSTAVAASAAPTQNLTIDQFIPILVALQSTQKFLSAAPTFVPQTFQDQVQFVFDGTSYSLYFYANNQWNKIAAAASTYLAQSFTAHAAITKAQALILGTGTSGYLTASQTTGPSTVTFATDPG